MTDQFLDPSMTISKVAHYQVKKSAKMARNTFCRSRSFFKKSWKTKKNFLCKTMLLGKTNFLLILLVEVFFGGLHFCCSIVILYFCLPVLTLSPTRPFKRLWSWIQVLISAWLVERVIRSGGRKSVLFQQKWKEKENEEDEDQTCFH